MCGLFISDGFAKQTGFAHDSRNVEPTSPCSEFPAGHSHLLESLAPSKVGNKMEVGSKRGVSGSGLCASFSRVMRLVSDWLGLGAQAAGAAYII